MRVHEIEGVRIAREILAKVDQPDLDAEAIVAIVDGHDTRKAAHSLNDAIMQDADKLSRFTAHGVALISGWFALPVVETISMLKDLRHAKSVSAAESDDGVGAGGRKRGDCAVCRIDARRGDIEMTTLGLEGKRVVVTGAAGGLGRAFAEAFARAGARVLAADVNLAEVKRTAAAIVEAGGEALACEVNVVDAASTARLAEVAREKLGGADALVNNAAIYAGLKRTALRGHSRERMGPCHERQRQGRLDGDQGDGALVARSRRRRDRQRLLGDGHERRRRCGCTMSRPRARSSP